MNELKIALDRATYSGVAFFILNNTFYLLNTAIGKLLNGIGKATNEEPLQKEEANIARAIVVGLGLIWTISTADLLLFGLIATLYFQAEETFDDLALDDLLRDTGVARSKQEKPTPTPDKAPKTLPLSDVPGQENKNDCVVKPIGRHLGNDPIHNQCADFAPPNVFQGSDVLVVTPDGRRKHFDAMDASGALWEIKTLNYSSYPQFLKDRVLEKEEFEIIADFHVARSCGREFVFAVSDIEHYNALLNIIPEGVNLKLVNCLTSNQ